VPQHDAGASLFKPLYADFSGTCATACGYGSYWPCAGHVVWPNATSNTVTLTWWVYDFTSGTGLAGADVSICTGCPCPGPFADVLAQGHTDQSGFYTVGFPNVLSPTGGGASICVQVTAPGYVTYLGYTEFPYTEPQAYIKNSLLPPSGWGNVLLPPTDRAQRIASTGITPDPDAGVMAAGIFDCLGSPAGGVHVSINTPDAAPWPALVDAGPDAMPTSVSAASGQFAGRAFFFNVPPGTYQLTATVPGVGRVSQVSGAVSGTDETAVAMPPTP
jgi:hypothetical protein